ncbi:MAG: CcdB family protein [Hyphomicrobium sp.]
MKRFDICPARGTGVRGRERLVIILQHEHLSDLATTVVAPLYSVRELPALNGLRPILTLGRKKFVIAIDRLVSIPKSQLATSVGSAEPIRFELLRAVDRLFSGF